MTDKTKTVSTTIEILGKIYPVRCPESEVNFLQQAAQFLDQKMTEVREAGKAMNLERIAIIAALNITYQYLQMDRQKNNFIDSINQKITQLQGRIESSMDSSLLSTLIYTAD